MTYFILVYAVITITFTAVFYQTHHNTLEGYRYTDKACLRRLRENFSLRRQATLREAALRLRLCSPRL
jgi:hypothetical protein